MLRAALYGKRALYREPGHRELDPDRVAKLQRDFDRLARRLSVPQRLAITCVSLDLWLPWLKRQLRGLPPLPGDARERQDLLEGLDAIGG